MSAHQPIFSRTERLLGEEIMDRIAQQRVIIFGVGGVGSWCAESLVRSGIGHLTMVDSDSVAISNVNRQVMATTKTVGRVKVEAMSERLLEINPEADIVALKRVYNHDTAADFNMESYDFVIDAIDSLSNKHDLIVHATSLPVHFFSSMGSALKMDGSKIAVDEFWNVQGCPLARALRKKMKRSGRYPARKFRCIYSPELLPNLGPDEDDPLLSTNDTEVGFYKSKINGTLSHITAIFGFRLAGLVVETIVQKVKGCEEIR